MLDTMKLKVRPRVQGSFSSAWNMPGNRRQHNFRSCVYSVTVHRSHTFNGIHRPQRPQVYMLSFFHLMFVKVRGGCHLSPTFKWLANDQPFTKKTKTKNSSSKIPERWHQMCLWDVLLFCVILDFVSCCWPFPLQLSYVLQSTLVYTWSKHSPCLGALKGSLYGKWPVNKVVLQKHPKPLFNFPRPHEALPSCQILTTTHCLHPVWNIPLYVRCTTKAAGAAFSMRWETPVSAGGPQTPQIPGPEGRICTPRAQDGRRDPPMCTETPFGRIT